ncbi:transmembrane protein 128-like [Tubulanus polymorphus]|uniref:transmembrane protein 128-like n=1 Tax=Tubulanus polymorphus TaxID=672921 RepID=UPI003DA641E5
MAAVRNENDFANKTDNLRQRTKESNNQIGSEDVLDQFNQNVYKFRGDANIVESEKQIEKPYSFANMCWFVSAAVVFYLTDFYAAIMYDERVDRFWFNVGVFFIAVNVCIATFLIGWLTFIKKVSTDDWEQLHPMAIPIASASFCFGSVFLILGLWPLWGFLTPFIMATLFMGFIVIVMLIPPYATRKEKPVVTKIDKDL